MDFILSRRYFFRAGNVWKSLGATSRTVSLRVVHTHHNRILQWVRRCRDEGGLLWSASFLPYVLDGSSTFSQSLTVPIGVYDCCSVGHEIDHHYTLPFCFWREQRSRGLSSRTAAKWTLSIPPRNSAWYTILWIGDQRQCCRISPSALCTYYASLYLKKVINDRSCPIIFQTLKYLLRTWLGALFYITIKQTNVCLLPNNNNSSRNWKSPFERKKVHAAQYVSRILV